MFSFFGGAAAVDGAESGRWGEALLGGALMGSGSNSNWTSAIGGGLFADGVRHHNVGEEIAGLTLGVLGAAASTSNSNNSYSSNSYSTSSYSPPSYHHHHHYHHETPAERAARVEHERLALIAEQKLAEERRIAREAQLQREREARELRLQREREARQQAIATEQQNQANRFTIYSKHLSLIQSSQKSGYDELKQEIRSLQPLPLENPDYKYIPLTYMGFPTERKNESVYSSLLGNQNLTPDHKLDLINRLQTKGYAKHEVQLIKNPALDLFLNEKSAAMADKLIATYENFLRNSHGALLEKERYIWKKIRDNQPGRVPDALRNIILYSTSHQKPMQFAIDWINSIDSPTDILAAHREINRIFTASKHLSLSDHTDTIIKFTKQRLLLLAKNNEAKEGSTTSEFDNSRVELFLNRHRGFHFCCQRTKSKEIYDELRKKSQRAETLFKEENTKIETTLTKLRLHMR